jgi:hypothetical protein
MKSRRLTRSPRQLWSARVLGFEARCYHPLHVHGAGRRSFTEREGDPIIGGEPRSSECSRVLLRWPTGRSTGSGEVAMRVAAARRAVGRRCPHLARLGPKQMGRVGPLCPGTSDLNLLGKG